MFLFSIILRCDFEKKGIIFFNESMRCSLQMVKTIDILSYVKYFEIQLYVYIFFKVFILSSFPQYTNLMF
jgi:hypothetical protein